MSREITKYRIKYSKQEICDFEVLRDYKLTYEKMAKKANINKSRLHKILNGKLIVPHKTMIDLCEKLNLKHIIRKT